MILEQSFRFEEELEHIIDFIALDSVAKALDFYDELINNIQNIPFRPYSYRKRLNSNDENLRELIFKGYTIPFFIDEKKGPFRILCQLGKIKNTKGHKYENRNRCRAIC